MAAATDSRPERKIEQNPFDLDGWNFLLRDNQRKPIDVARPFYERLLIQFPNAGRFWKAYIEHELKARNFEGVEKLFQKCLMKVMNIELWKCYLNYVRETKGHLPSFREKMAQAYDFALDKIGMDSLSLSVYLDYINFLKHVPAIGSYAENQRIIAVRKIYQRAIVTPIFNVENLWNEYCVYEKNVNPQLGEKLIADKLREYQNARRVSKMMETIMKGINRAQISVPPKGTPAEIKQVELWKKYIQWEKSNPLQTEDYSLYAKRVEYAYEQALLCLGYYPDIWYEAAVFLQEASKTLSDKGDAKASNTIAEEISALYERATSTLLKTNMLLFFAYADYEEERMKYEKVQQIYNRFIDIVEVDPTLAYIQYMKFSRRTEGIKSARTIFKRAREDSRSKCQVYVAAALMEYYCTKDTNVAFKIFELGLKKYQDRAEFAIAYIDYLSHLNEDNNTRVLFERILTSGGLPAGKSLEVWDKYLEFESHVGDLASITKVDKRRRQALEKEFESLQTILLIDRYKFMDLYPCSPEELKSLGYSRAMKSVSGATFCSSNTSNLMAERFGSSKSSGDLGGYPRPDVSQMIPFKPKIITTSSYHPVPGGVFPPPPAVAHLLSIIPPPWCFNGPFVAVDALLDKFTTAVLPEDGVPLKSVAPVSENGGSGTPAANDPKLDEIKKEFYQLLATTADPVQLMASNQETRKRIASKDDEDESSSTQQPAPAHDIYRLRQQYKKVARS